MTVSDAGGIAIAPGASLGVLGGGQLGSFFLAAARRMGYRVVVWDPDPHAPALDAADRAVAQPFEDPSGLESFVSDIRAATYEWENVPSAIAQAVEQRVPLRPGARILGIIQNRVTQKSFLDGHGFPVAAFRAVSDPLQLAAAADAVGFPCVCKTATAGYDGKGQWRLDDRESAAALQAELAARPTGPREWIIERFLHFERELSVLVARSTSGETRTYPVVDNLHEGGILLATRVPADLAPAAARGAAALARSVIDALDLVGVACVELFRMADGSLFVNEVAPRPHNSGHYTLDASATSQFEQQVRALCGLPLGDARLLSPAVMLNLIGEAFTRAMQPEGLEAIMRTPGAALHVYGKREVRSRRKMGHVTVRRERPKEAWEAAMALRRLFMAGDYARPRG